MKNNIVKFIHISAWYPDRKGTNLSDAFLMVSLWNAVVDMVLDVSGLIGEIRLKVWRDNNGTKRFF